MSTTISKEGVKHRADRNRPARIAYVITDLRLGGVPLHLLRLVDRVRAHGFDPCVISLAPRGTVSDRLEGAGVPTFSCDARGPWDAGAVLRLGRLLGNRKPELIHSFLFHANIASRLACKWLGFPADRLLCEIQTVEIERRWHLPLDHLTFHLCRCEIGNSRSVTQHLVESAGLPPERVKLIEGGVDAGAIAAASRIDLSEYGVTPKHLAALWVGRFDRVKDLPTLIRAFRIVVDQTPAMLFLVGDGPERPFIQRLVRSLGLSGRVVLPGLRSDVPCWLKAADVFCFPSLTEGLPNVVLEAMAAAAPVVASDAPGCRDLIEHGATGLLFSCGDAEALAAHILRLAKDKAEARRLAGRAKELVHQRYCLERMVDRYAACYREALQTPGSAAE